jgi:hypothetical protein
MQRIAINTPIASKEEVGRRKKIQNWLANNRLEGIKPTKEALDLLELYIQEQISIEEYGQRVRAKYSSFREK